MKGKDKDRVLYISHSGEILIWLVVILLFISLSSLGLIFKDKISENDYRVFLQDVDGLIVGSPVRMMGIEVGHVTKIKPVKDEMYVKFVLTNPDVFIPQGTYVTVEFSGMACSKSLELYLPQKGAVHDESAPLLFVQPPKRLHDALSLLNDMFKKLGSIIYTTSDFGSKLNEQELIPTQIINSESNMEQFLEYSNKFLDESNKKADDIRNSLEGLKKDVK